MKVTIHCEGTPSEIAKQLQEAAEVYSSAEETSTISIAEIKKNRKGKKGKDEPAPEEEETEEEETTDPDDESGEEEETEEEDFGEEEEEGDDEKLSEEDLGKLKAALGKYKAKHDKKKAVAILHKFAKTSDAVKPADLPKLLKLLKV